MTKKNSFSYISLTENICSEIYFLFFLESDPDENEVDPKHYFKLYYCLVSVVIFDMFVKIIFVFKLWSFDCISKNNAAYDLSELK